MVAIQDIEARKPGDEKDEPLSTRTETDAPPLRDMLDAQVRASNALCRLTANSQREQSQGDRILGSQFMRLSALEQACVCNELMRSVSTSATACIMTTLPPPPAVASTGTQAAESSNRSRASSRSRRRSSRPPTGTASGSSKHFSEYAARGAAGVVDDAMTLAKRARMDGAIDAPSDPTEYYRVVEHYSRNLPPILMVHGVSVTVTTQL